MCFLVNPGITFRCVVLLFSLSLKMLTSTAEATVSVRTSFVQLTNYYFYSVLDHRRITDKHRDDNVAATPLLCYFGDYCLCSVPCLFLVYHSRIAVRCFNTD